MVDDFECGLIGGRETCFGQQEAPLGPWLVDINARYPPTMLMPTRELCKPRRRMRATPPYPADKNRGVSKIASLNA